MISPEDLNLSTALVNQFTNRARAQAAYADVAYEFSATLLGNQPSEADLVESFANEHAIDDSTKFDELDEPELAVLAKDVLKSYVTRMAYEKACEERREVAFKTQLAEDEFKRFITQHIGRTITISQLDKSAHPDIKVYVPQMQPGVTYESSFGLEGNPDVTATYLRNWPASYTVHEASGLLHPATVTLKRLVLAIQPESDRFSTEPGLIVANVVDDFTQNPTINVDMR